MTERGLRSSCEGCRRRKVKCTGETPNCARCERLQSECVYMERAKLSRVISRRSGSPTFRETSQRAVVASSRQAAIPVATPMSSSVIDASPVTTQSAHHSVNEPNVRSPSPTYLLPQFPIGSQLSESLPAGPDLFPEPATANDVPMLAIDSSDLPSQSATSALIEHFATYTNAAFPVIHVPSLKAIAASAASGSEINSLDACILFLTLAVSTQSLHRRSPLHSQTKGATTLFDGAKALLNVAHSGRPTLRKLQIRFLHLQYTLYNPREGSNIWELSGTIMRLAIDLGLHHERDGTLHHAVSSLDIDIRRRLFWSAYCVDRNLSIALGRPPAISDEWINTPMFSESSDAVLSRVARLSPSASLEQLNTTCPIKASALHHVRIRRLQSEIQARLYRLPDVSSHARAGTEPALDGWMQSMCKEVNDWRVSAPSPTGFCSSTWFDLNYHITMTYLNRPAPCNPKPSKNCLILARQGASGVMRTYKEMLKAGRINWSWLSMYQLFIAGIAYLNSLWQAADQDWTIVPSYVEALLDVQVCTSVMSALSATTPGCSSLCTAFETLSERIIRQLTSRASWASLSRASSPTPQIGLGEIAVLSQGFTETLPTHLASSQSLSDWSAPQLQLPDSWAALDADQRGVDEFLASLGFGQGPHVQTAFDSLFLHPMPDLPTFDIGGSGS